MNIIYINKTIYIVHSFNQVLQGFGGLVGKA
jgi:hypothetical protein